MNNIFNCVSNNLKIVLSMLFLLVIINPQIVNKQFMFLNNNFNLLSISLILLLLLCIYDNIMENASVEQLITGGKKRKNKKKGGEQKEKENVKKTTNENELNENELNENESNEPSGIMEPSSEVCGEICGDDTECFEVCNEAFRE